MSKFLEITSLVFFLAWLVIFGIAMEFWQSFVDRSRKNKRIDPQDCRLTAQRGFKWMLVGGICATIGGLSLSLWSPAGLERLAVYDILLVYLACEIGPAFLFVAMFLISSNTFRLLLEQKAKRKDEELGQE
jgi:hypothetical protein